jgi:hypothetical protein
MSMRFSSHSLRSLVLQSHAASTWNKVWLIGRMYRYLRDRSANDGASDLSGSMVGALASTALAWQKYGNDSAFVDRLMKGATALYKDAKKYEGSYTARFTCAPLLSVRFSLCHLPVLAAGVFTCWPE